MVCLTTVVTWAVPTGGLGVVVVFDEQWVSEVEKALTRADRISRNHLHDDDVEETATQ